MKLLIDTGVALRHGFVRDAFQARVHSLLRAEASSNRELVLAPQVLYELYVVATRPRTSNGYGLNPVDAVTEIRRIAISFPVLPEPPDIVNTWLELCERNSVSGKSAHDARLVAFMLCHAIEGIITLNPQDFSRFTEIQTLVP